MFTIETFHKMLSKHSGRRDPYLHSLFALTKLTPRQIHALTSDMIWLEW
jgi:hypothetical protein